MELINVHSALVAHESDLSESRFTNAKLLKSRFSNVNLQQASFTDVNLTGASFADVNLSNASITNANLEGTRIKGILVPDLVRAYGTWLDGARAWPKRTALVPHALSA